MRTKIAFARVAELVDALASGASEGNLMEVQVFSCAPQSRIGRLAQLARASRLHREGRGFEPLTAHQVSLWAYFLYRGIFKDDVRAPICPQAK